MRVVFLGTYKSKGGAAVAAKRAFESVSMLGVNATFVDSDTLRFSRRFSLNLMVRKVYAKLGGLLRARSLIPFSVDGPTNSALIKYINALKPDIVHLHWINDGFLALSDLLEIEAPIVWTLHDMWPLTGGCHVNFHCNYFERSCGNCFLIKSNSPVDISSINFRKKQQIISKLDVYFVAVSEWLRRRAELSPITQNCQIDIIPNTIDVSNTNHSDDFPLQNYRGKLEDEPLKICFGANKASKDSNKGFDILIESILSLTGHFRFHLFVFGAQDSGAISLPEGLKRNVSFLGALGDQERDKLLKDCDVTVMPSRQESFGQVAVESLACGTPVVCFKTTALEEIIDHKVDGYVADYLSALDLANGIKWIRNNCSNDMSVACINKVAERYAYETVGRQYLSLYSSILSKISNK